jgi:putative DNA primase/helicase
MSDAISKVVGALDSRGCRPRSSGDGWKAHCPAHDDREPSLSVGEGKDGRALVHCYAGCSHTAIARALGLEERDLFSNNALLAFNTPKRNTGTKPARGFATWREAIPRSLSSPTRHWEYQDSSSSLVGIAARWDSDDGSKTYRPLAMVGGRWHAKAMPEPRPIYRLPAVLTSDTVFVVEGEKCADALAGLGYTATTSSMGAKAAKQTDWSALAGKHIVILPDHDAPGEKYAADVARLAQAANAADVSIVRIADHWPACPPGGDIADLLDAFGDAAEPAAIRQRIDGIVATATLIVTSTNESQPAYSQPAGAANVSDRTTQTDAGLCKRLCHEGRGRILWVADRKTWVRWDDRRWVDDPDGGEPRRTSKAIATALWSEAGPDASNALVKFCRDAASRRGIDAAVSLAKSEPGIEVTADVFDAKPYEINCANGILDLEKMVLRPHDPAGMMTKLAGVPFDPHAECPRWRRFLAEVMLENDEMIAYMQRALGLALSADVSEQILFCHWGEGSNGKSLLFSVLAQILGDYAAPIPADVLVSTAGERDREKSVARLAGRRLCYAQEPDEGGRLAEGSLKAITGGDRLTARLEYERARVVTPTWHVHVCMNRLPIVHGTDYGLWRRLHVIRWGRTFGPDEQRPRSEIERELLAEAPGILRWLCAGFTAWRQGGLRPPECVANFTEGFRRFSDSVARWLDSDEVAREDGVEAPAGELYAAYCRFCDEQGCHAVSQTMFGRSLEGRGIKSTRPKAGRWRNMTVRVGLCLTAADARISGVGA